MAFSRVLGSGVVLSALGAFAMSGWMSPPVCGRAVSDFDAAQIRGGYCQNVKQVQCPDPDGAGECSSGTKVVGGETYGNPMGNVYCADGCGSFFSYFKAGCS